MYGIVIEIEGWNQWRVLEILRCSSNSAVLSFKVLYMREMKGNSISNSAVMSFQKDARQFLGYLIFLRRLHLYN